jgi:hypothetical protein
MAWSQFARLRKMSTKKKKATRAHNNPVLVRFDHTTLRRVSLCSATELKNCQTRKWDKLPYIPIAELDVAFEKSPGPFNLPSCPLMIGPTDAHDGAFERRRTPPQQGRGERRNPDCGDQILFDASIKS